MAIVNFTNYPKGQTKGGMSAVMRYTEREDKTKYGDRQLVSGVNCRAETAYDDFMRTKLLYNKTDGRQFYHMVQSFPKGAEVDPAKAHEAALKLAEYFKDHEVLVCTHTDRDHVHSHCIINSVNFETGKKLHVAQKQIQELKMLNDKICMEMGLPVFEAREQQKVKPMTIAEYHVATKGESWKFQLMNTIDDAMRFAGSKDEFITLMRSEGYDVKWTDSRKNITYTTPSGMKCRDDRLHDEKYLKEMMEREFEYRRTESPEPQRRFDSEGGRTNRDGHREKLDGSAEFSFAPLATSGGNGRTAPGANDLQRRGKPAGGDRAERAESNNPLTIGGQELQLTGWEDERGFFLRRREAGYEHGEVAERYSQYNEFGAEGYYERSPQVAPAYGDNGDSLGGIADSFIRLGRVAENTADDTIVRDATTTPQHTDSKTLSKEREKKIAMGHKANDHEDELNNKYYMEIGGM